MQKYILFPLLVCAFFSPITAKAVKEYQIREDGNWFVMGGINSYGEKTMESREETEALERQLLSSDYQLLHGTDRQITEEEMNLLGEYGLWFLSYIQPDNEFYEMYKVYVFSPSYQEFLEQAETGSVDWLLVEEVSDSAVVIDDAYWWSLERVGTDCSEEINDGIPDWYTTSFLQITSPIDVEITFLFQSEQNFYTLYVPANTAFIVKMKAGAYQVTEVNGMEFAEGEPYLPFGNLIQLLPSFTEKKPYQLAIDTLVNTYQIPPEDISQEPDRSYLTREFPVEKTTVEPTEPENKETKKKIPFFPFLIVVTILLCGIGIYYYIRKVDD